MYPTGTRRHGPRHRYRSRVPCLRRCRLGSSHTLGHLRQAEYTWDRASIYKVRSSREKEKLPWNHLCFQLATNNQQLMTSFSCINRNYFLAQR